MHTVVLCKGRSRCYQKVARGGALDWIVGKTSRKNECLDWDLKMKSHSGERRSKWEENTVGKSIKKLGVLQKLKGDTSRFPYCSFVLSQHECWPQEVLSGQKLLFKWMHA